MSRRDDVAAQDHVVCGPDCQCGCEAGRTIPVRSAARNADDELRARSEIMGTHPSAATDSAARNADDELRARSEIMGTHPSAATDSAATPSGADLIAAERQRQIDAEGWTPDHDDGHTLGEMAAAGACYALLNTRWKDSSILGSQLVRHILWPWDDEWFKPTEYPEPPYTANVHLDRHQRDLVKAGALIAAEIDRLERTRRGS